MTNIKLRIEKIDCQRRLELVVTLPNMHFTHRYTYIQYMYKLGVWFAFIILYLQLAGDIYKEGGRKGRGGWNVIIFSIATKKLDWEQFIQCRCPLSGKQSRWISCRTDEKRVWKKRVSSYRSWSTNSGLFLRFF